MNPYDNDMIRVLAREAAAAQEMERLRREYAWLDESPTYAQLLRDAARWEEQARQLRDAMGPGAYVDHLAAIARATQDARERWTQLGVGEVAIRIAADLDRWRVETQGLEARLRDATALERQLSGLAVTAFEESFRRTAALAELWGAPDRAGITGLMLAPAEGFGRYARSATRRIVEAEEPDERAVGEIGLALAESALEATDGLHEIIAEVDRDLGTAGLRIAIAQPLNPARVLQVSIRIEGFYTAQEKDALANMPLLVGEDGQPMSTVPTSGRSKRQVEFGTLIAGCLSEARVHQRALPINLGEAVLAFVAELGVIDASDEAGLGRLVDGMYFTLYEATDNKRRLHPYLSDDRLATVDRVQLLRNRVFRHAFDQERQVAIAHQAPEILEALQAFGLTGRPHTTGERLTLHDALLDGGIALLHELIEAIRR